MNYQLWCLVHKMLDCDKDGRLFYMEKGEIPNPDKIAEKWGIDFVEEDDSIEAVKIHPNSSIKGIPVLKM